MKYKLLNAGDQIIDGITIDSSAKEDFKSMMNWNESTWQRRTMEVV